MKNIICLIFQKELYSNNMAIKELFKQFFYYSLGVARHEYKGILAEI